MLAGNAAILSMGGQVRLLSPPREYTQSPQILGFCGGRVDAVDGSESIQLGPSALQEQLAPCESLGLQVGLGQGHGVTTAASRTGSVSCRWAPTPWASSTSTPRVTWRTGTRSRAPGTSGRCSPGGWSVVRVMVTVAPLARMGMDDEEAVALIGGGHGVGKAHGACPLGAGPAPSEDPFNPWPGRCGAGKLEEAFTSGLELPWTTRPTSWDNEFFSNLLDYEWELHEVSSPRLQWTHDSAQ